jgi:hypothetical protein
MALPVPPDTVRCNLVWDLGENEIAVNSFHFAHQHVTGNTLDWPGDMTQRYAALLHDAILSQKTAVLNYLPSTTKMLRVDAYHLREDGLADVKKTQVFTAGENMQGTSAGVSLPKEVALVVSLYGYAIGDYDPDGGRKRGRIYLPAPTSSAMSGQGRYGQAQATATAWAAVMSYTADRVMDSATGAHATRERARPVILSRKFTSTSDVKQVRVDDLLDVQRRRQNQLAKNMAQAAIVPQTTP